MGINRRGIQVQQGTGWIGFDIDNATPTSDGAMSSTDKSKLDSITSAAPPIPNTRKTLIDNAAGSLIVIDLDIAGDNSWGGWLFFTIESTDGVNVQVLTGRVIANLARASNGSISHAHVEQSNVASTSGTLSATFDWITAGSTATLQVTPSSTLTPTDLHINFYLPYASHPDAVSVV